MVDVTPDGPAADPGLTIEVSHSSYYRWLPIREEDVKEGDVVIDSTFPGFKMIRTLINEPTTTKTYIALSGLEAINGDRFSAGLETRPHHVNLTRHLEDGSWPKHFPLGEITAITCDDHDIESKLQSYFIADPVKPHSTEEEV